MSRLPWEKPRIPVTPAEHVRAYVEDYGWSLCPLRPGTKIPIFLNWHDPLQVISADGRDADALAPDQGIGLVHAHAHTGAFDVDHVEYARLALAEFGIDYDRLMVGYPRIRSRDGKDKILFRLPDDFDPSNGSGKIKLTWPDESGECDERGRPLLVTVFELRGGLNQDVLPPSIHPDTHAPYEWSRPPWDFPKGIPEAPAELIALWREWKGTFEAQLRAACPWAPPPAGSAPPDIVRQVSREHGNVIGQFNAAVPCAEILERNGYVRKGKRWLAPSSSTKIPGVNRLRGEGGAEKVYSHHASDPLNNGHAHDAFSLLVVLEHNDDVGAAVQGAALELGVDVRESVDPAIDYQSFVANTMAKQTRRSKAHPIAAEKPVALDRRLVDQAPGMLGQIVSWGLSSAHKPLPHITLQAAFAIASAAASRRYRSNLNNWPSLWFLNLEVTASGKEHPESLIEAALEPAGLGNLIAGAGYTSPGAIFSALMDKPAHIAVLDEFGKLMESSQAKGNQHKEDAITLLMQAFSACHRTLRPPAYSTMTLSRDQREALANRKVCNPGVVIYASTTPATFYTTITRQRIADGFLGRFLTCHSQTGRQLSCSPSAGRAPPEPIVDWLCEVACRPRDPSKAVRSAGIDAPCDQPPEPISLTFSPEAERLLASIEGDIHARMGANERWGVEALYGRTREKAMRLAMLAALAENAQGRTIGESLTQYAIDYILAMDDALVMVAKTQIADSDFARIKHLCLEHVRKAGTRGLTSRDLEKKAAAFDALRPREQQEILAALANSGLIEQQTSTGPSGRGKKRHAWVAVSEEVDDE